LATASAERDDTRPNSGGHPSQSAPTEGRLPFVLRIGVTGHRKLEDPVAAAEWLHEAVTLVRDLIPPLPATEVVLAAVSALAEGTDRLLAIDVLSRPGSRLEVSLPMPRSEYMRDFAEADSQEEFSSLLAQASRIWQAPSQSTRDQPYDRESTRQKSYLRAGQHVVDQSDVVIAFWNGLPPQGPGGTADIVDYARAGGVPLVWIRPDGRMKFEFDVERVETLREAARDLNDYNRAVIPQLKAEAATKRQRGYLGLGEGKDNPLRSECDQVANWLMPFFVRADLLAIRLQRWFLALSSGMFAMAAVAVAIVAIQINFWPTANWVAGFEVLILLFLLGIPLLRNRMKLNERWASHRFLAERLRSAYFLALAGTGDKARQDRRASFSDPTVAWVERAMAEIMTHRTRPELTVTDVEPLRAYLAEHWIEDQEHYHDTASDFHEKWDVRLRRATATLFGITLISAVLHLAGIGHHGVHTSDLAETLIVLSISVPALGAAVHGVETQGLYRHHAKRYERMSKLLNQLVEPMEHAPDLQHIRSIAIEVERIMREESNDWFGVMRFHDVELIT
jgi:hypothetical protein